MRINNQDLLEDSGPVSMGSSFALEPIWLGNIINYSIQIVFTGTPGGNFKLQVSNDPGRNELSREIDPTTITNWTDVLDSAQTISAAGDITWDVQNSGVAYVRVVWTHTGGTGTLTSARCFVKGV